MAIYALPPTQARVSEHVRTVCSLNPNKRVHPAQAFLLTDVHARAASRSVLSSRPSIFYSFLFQILKADEVMSKRFSALAAGLLKPIAAEVGWEPKEADGHSGKLLRATVIELLAT